MTFHSPTRLSTIIGVLFCLFVGVLSACSTSNVGTGDDTDGDESGLRSCRENDDCRGGEICAEKICRTFCREASDCKETESCLERACIPNEPADGDELEPDGPCKDDNDCGGGQVCSNEFCRSVCATQKDCEMGYECRSEVCIPVNPVDGDKEPDGDDSPDGDADEELGPCDDFESRCDGQESVLICEAGNWRRYDCDEICEVVYNLVSAGCGMTEVAGEAREYCICVEEEAVR